MLDTNTYAVFDIIEHIFDVIDATEDERKALIISALNRIVSKYGKDHFSPQLRKSLSICFAISESTIRSIFDEFVTD